MPTDYDPSTDPLFASAQARKTFSQPLEDAYANRWQPNPDDPLQYNRPEAPSATLREEAACHAVALETLSAAATQPGFERPLNKTAQFLRDFFQLPARY